MPINLCWTPEREEFYRLRPCSSLEELIAGSKNTDKSVRDDWIDAEARGAIIPHRGGDR